MSEQWKDRMRRIQARIESGAYSGSGSRKLLGDSRVNGASTNGSRTNSERPKGADLQRHVHGGKGTTTRANQSGKVRRFGESQIVRENPAPPAARKGYLTPDIFVGIHERDWKRQLALVLKLKITQRAVSKGNTKSVGYRTEKKRRDELFLCFSQLYEMGYKLPWIYSLREKHVRVLILKWEKEGLAGATIQSRVTMLRTFCNWFGKVGMVKNAACYVKDPAKVKLKRETEVDKSWEAKNVNFNEILALVGAKDKYVRMQLEIIEALGARREEAVQFRPHIADMGYCVRLAHGTKGGRPRFVPIINAKQREVLDRAKKFVEEEGRGLDGHIGRPRLSLQQALARFSYVLRSVGISKDALGVTPHGLRHQFAINYALYLGDVPPVREKDMTAEQLEAFDSLPEEMKIVYRKRVSEALGHSRSQIAYSYCGKPSKPVTNKKT